MDVLSRVLAIVLGLTAAAAYSVLMPLWEGYDEPFHYGIVQSVGIERSIPDPSRTPVSEELWQSRLLAPSSPVFNRDVPPIRTFGQFHALAPAERTGLRRALDELPAGLQYRPHPGPPNYEAQQPPFAYALLAIPDRVLSREAITLRVLVLRLLIALLTVVVTTFGMLKLGREIEIPKPFLIGAVTLVLMTQTYLGAVCRVSNDWVGIALAPWLVVNAIGVLRAGGARYSSGLGMCLAAGLLAKANYVAFVPLAFGVVGISLLQRRLSVRAIVAFAVPVSCAVPWYVRNIVVHGSVTGWHPQLSNPTAGGALAALRALPWLECLPRFLHAALWNGNNHYTAFSRATLDAFLVLLFAAALLTIRQLLRQADRQALLVLLSGVGLYAASLVYSIGELFVVHGNEYALMPWYCAPLFPLLAPLLYWGLSRSGRAGRWTATALLSVATYVFAATWLVKLIPLYAGFSGNSKVGPLVDWLSSSWRDAHAKLGAVTLGPVWCAYLLLCVTLACAVALLIRNTRGLFAFAGPSDSVATRYTSVRT